jgi:hypothetical protein
MRKSQTIYLLIEKQNIIILKPHNDVICLGQVFLFIKIRVDYKAPRPYLVAI